MQEKERHILHLEAEVARVSQSVCSAVVFYHAMLC